jgi:hypothetical protein
VERRLDSVNVKVREGFAVSVILASQGYPGSYAKGKVIEFGKLPEGAHYHLHVLQQRLMIYFAQEHIHSMLGQNYPRIASSLLGDVSSQ